MAAANPSMALSKRDSTLGGGDNHNESFKEEDYSDEDHEDEESYSAKDDS